MSHRIADALHEVTDSLMTGRPPHRIPTLHALPHSCCSLQGALADAWLLTQQAVTPRQMYSSQYFSAHGILLLRVLLMYTLIMYSPLCCRGSIYRLLSKSSSICSLPASLVLCRRLRMRTMPVTAWCRSPARHSTLKLHALTACAAAACQHKLQIA